MIKVGIDGAGSPEAGELIRLLINHPDVELVSISQPELSGRDVSDIHHGLIGEKKLPFSKKVDYDEVDIIFYTSSAIDASLETSDSFINSKNEPDSGFAIYVSPSDEMIDATSPFFLKCSTEIDEDKEPVEDWSTTVVYGVPELNRKPLVRGARKVVIPTALESASIVMLLPFANRVNFPEHIVITAKGAKEIIANYSAIKDSVERRLEMTFSQLLGKEVKISINLNEDDSTTRGLSLYTDVPAAVTLDEMRNIVSETYDDHNLAYLSGKSLTYHEIEGTDKCLIEINRIDSGIYRISSFVDARMRGGAGEAIHVMNLFSGLFEKTGLHLKASIF